MTTFVANVNFVEVPVIVKDSKGEQVAGLTYRDFKVFENNTREVIACLQRGTHSALHRFCH